MRVTVNRPDPAEQGVGVTLQEDELRGVGELDQGGGRGGGGREREQGQQNESAL